jgi:hypothetical protein
MTQLDANISSSDTVIVVDTGSEQDNGFRFRIHDEILTFLGYDRDSTADILSYLDGDRTRWRVARAQDGTEAASHLAGATLYAVVEGFVTGTDLTPPDPFTGNAPTSPFALSDRVLTANVTIPANKGAITVGPLDLAGFDITFGENSALAVLEPSE